MSAPVPSDDKRPFSRLTLLFRCGLAVAALAALLLLVADGNAVLRIAAVLAITSIAMIGLSIALRPDTAAEVRYLAAEIDELRAELTAVEQLARQSAEPVRAVAGSASVRGNDVPAAPAEPPRSGRARVAVPEPDAADERPEAADGPERHRAAAHPADQPEPARSTDHRSADEPRSADGSGRRRAAGADHGPAADDPDEHDSPWAGESPGGRRRAKEPEDERARSADRGVGRRRAPEPEDEEPYAERRSTAGWYPDEEPPARSRRTSRYAARPSGGVYGGASRPDGPDVHPDEPSGPEVPSRPVGVVRHTETVHVTTRHTIVDGTAGEPGADGGYRGWAAPEERGWSGRAPEPGDRWDGYPPASERSRSGYSRGSARPVPPGRRDDPSWDAPPPAADRPERRTSTWPRGRHGTDADEAYRRPTDDEAYRRPTDEDAYRRPVDEAAYRRPTGDEAYRRPVDEDAYRRPAGGDGWGRRAAADRPGPGRTYRSADEGDADWAEVRAGGRWATARDDERGQELRMGEHRAAVHADSTGTEVRVEDRWAAVRRARRARPDDGYDRDRPERGGPPEYPRGGHRADPDRSDRALPPGGVPMPDQWRSERYDPYWDQAERVEGRPERRY